MCQSQRVLLEAWLLPMVEEAETCAMGRQLLGPIWGVARERQYGGCWMRGITKERSKDTRNVHDLGGTAGPIMPAGSSAVSLTYLASEKVVPGYGGGMSSAKAQLESDTKVVDPP